MSVTAARLGHSPLLVDWSHLVLGHTSSHDGSEFDRTWKALKSRFGSKEVGFYDSLFENEISQASESEALAGEILAQGKFSDCLFLGIGGSALGPISLLSALKEKCVTSLRFHFIENPDPQDWKQTLKSLSPESTLVCAVTKSGTTFETVAQLLLALDWLGKERWKSHLVALTDPEKGDLRKFSNENGIKNLSIHPSLGGRFSIFSPVGLFPAALAGLSTKDFLLGASQIRDAMEKIPSHKNPLFIISEALIDHYSKRPIHVCMPYSTRLRLFGSWFVQLWGESLGKDGRGFTPISALGATDQHSILQLLRDGPDDKITWFMSIDQTSDPVSIPQISKKHSLKQLYPAFSLLEGHSLHELMTVEYHAISKVLTRKEKPHLHFQLDCLDEKSMGALYFAFSVLTAFTGTLWGVNPFDQPGVEEGKIYIKQSLEEKRSLA